MKEQKYKYSDDFGSIGVRGEITTNEDYIDSIVSNHELETITPRKNQIDINYSKMNLTDFFDLKDEELVEFLGDCNSCSINGNVLTIRISDDDNK